METSTGGNRDSPFPLLAENDDLTYSDLNLYLRITLDLVVVADERRSPQWAEGGGEVGKDILEEAKGSELRES